MAKKNEKGFMDALYWALLTVRRLQAERRGLAANDPKVVKKLLAEIRRAKAEVKERICREADSIKAR